MTSLPHEMVITSIEADNPDADPADVAAMVLSAMTPAQLQEILLAAIIAAVEEVRRARARSIEQRAVRLGRGHIKRRPPLMAATPAEEKQRQELFERDREKYSGEFGLTAALTRYRMKVTLDLSAELLASTFQLGDGGPSVTWGAATLTQHRARIDLLMGNISGNMETMRIHELAADMIVEKKVRCLNEVG